MKIVIFKRFNKITNDKKYEYRDRFSILKRWIQIWVKIERIRESLINW